MRIRTTVSISTLALAALLGASSAVAMDTVRLTVAPFDLSVSNVQTSHRGSLLQVSFDATGTGGLTCITYPCAYAHLEGAEVEVVVSTTVLLRPGEEGDSGGAVAKGITRVTDIWDWRRVRITSPSFPSDYVFSDSGRSQGDGQCSGSECNAVLSTIGPHHDGILLLLFEVQRSQGGLTLGVTGYESPAPFSFDVPAGIVSSDP
jgi:hypothetical protein